MLRTRQHFLDESGVALVFALLAVLVLGGLATLFVSRAVFESRATASEQRFETTIHIAEAAVDDLIFSLNTDFTIVTQDPGGTEHSFDPTAIVTEGQQRAWAVDKAANECVLTDADVDLGQACAIRPRLTTTGLPAPFIFGVGFIPDAADADKIRVVKLGIRLGDFVPAQSILTNGNLNPLNITICGEERDVHSNSTMTVQGSADTVTPGTKSDGCPENASGKVTSYGSFTTSGSPDIDPGSGQTGKKIHVPAVSALELYKEALSEKRSDGSDNPDFQRNRDNWYTLCSNGTVKGPNIDGSGNVVLDPCGSGAPTKTYTGSFRGWKPPNNATAPWSAGGGSNSAPLLSGIYYVHERNASISGGIGGDVQVSLIVDAVGKIVPFERHDSPSSFGADRTCAANGKNDGNISIQGVGGGDMEPFMPHMLYVADRDVSMGGNVSSDLRGVIAAHEQTGLGGTPNIVGAVVAEDACRDSSQSPESKNYVSGSFKLDHSFPLTTLFPSIVHITAWNEYS